MTLLHVFQLLRIQQWYKNLVIFLPIIFAAQLSNTNLLLYTVLGFMGLCCISSANYILNDIIDRERDKVHPEKRARPISAGKINIPSALIIAVIICILGLYIGYTLSLSFLLLEIVLLVITSLYTLGLKNEPFVDVLLISTNFTIRAVAGTYVFVHPSNIFSPILEISPWLILCPFFLALFLALAKKYGDLVLLGKKSINHKQSFRFYSIQSLDSYMTISTTLLIISYSLFSFLSKHKMLITLPFALYTIFRYYYFIHSKPEIARDPYKVITDMRMILGILLWFVFVLLALYL